MARKLDYRWHLRQVMASRGMFATTDLIGPLAERGIRLSSSQVYRLVTERPERLSLKILMALLDILDCTMDELIEPVAAARPAAKPGTPAAARPGSATCGPSGPGSPGPASDGDCWRPDVLADPVGVIVGLVAGVEPALGRAAIRGLVISVAGGRAKRRRLARALIERPAVLADGRSPAPRVVGDLLIALRTAGATGDLAAGLRRLRQGSCAPCSAAARTGTAASAVRGASAARRAATPGR